MKNKKKQYNIVFFIHIFLVDVLLNSTNINK